MVDALDDEPTGVFVRLADLLGAPEPALRLLTSILLGNVLCVHFAQNARVHDR